MTSLPHVNQEVPEYLESDTDLMGKLTRSQSEKLLLVTKEYYQQEKELKEKYHDIVNTLL